MQSPGCWVPRESLHLEEGVLIPTVGSWPYEHAVETEIPQSGNFPFTLF